MYRQNMYSMQLPLLGTMTQRQLMDTLYNSIVGEATAAEFYGRLEQDAPDDLHRDFIEDARTDELDHLSHFQRLYEQYFGPVPEYTVDPVQYPSYKEGLLMALKDELDTVGFYKDAQLSTRDRLVRDTYYYAMVDELEHAVRFSTLYNST